MDKPHVLYNLNKVFRSLIKSGALKTVLAYSLNVVVCLLVREKKSNSIFSL
jgi:hypothetical protein